MSASLDPHLQELPSTYIVLDLPNKDELERLKILDDSVTGLMGGVLPEQPDPGTFQDVLDVACGPGGWVIKAAQAYPTMSLVGVDISRQMIINANERAERANVTGRVRFQIMDIQHKLNFPNASFDLVNMRLASTFLRTWEWKKVVIEMLRVTRPGGIIRITDALDLGQSNSPALMRFGELVELALTRGWYFSDDKTTSHTRQLMTILEQLRCTQVQTRTIALEYHHGTPEWEDFFAAVQYSFRTLRPFLQRRGYVPKDYETICKQAISEMQQDDFHATWHILTVWGQHPATDDD
jgi:ubiquinone/menaquinone biosynthesis C-methylase UbiE